MFVANELHGFGKSYNRENNTLYVGMWVEDKWHGQGKLRCNNGDFYEGIFHEGKRHGRGKMTYSDGTVYEGDWHNDQKHGQGCLTHLRTNARANGLWQNDIFVE